MKTETPIPTATGRFAEAGFDPVGELEPKPFHLQLRNILVPLDFSENSLKALRYAVPFARQFGATLTLLHVIELVAYTPELPEPAPLPAGQHEAVTAQLEQIWHREIPKDIHVNTIVSHDFVFDGVLAAAREIHADLIITTTHGHTGLMHLLMGSTAESIVRRAPCPVLVVRDVEDAPN